MENYLLSIVIATKGREFFCQKCVEVMLSFITDKTQIVISDNSNSNKLSEFISKFDDRRINYRHTYDNLTMSENYNLALSMATGDYICMIGDDDIVLPSIYKAIEFAIEKKTDCITQAKVINYIWPFDNSNGIIYLPKFTKKYKEKFFKDEIIYYFKNGCCVNPRDFSLPSIYHGIVKKETLDKVKEQTGLYINGISPDSYMAVALCQVINSQYELDYPFTIGGACPGSATVSNMKGEHSGALENSIQYLLNIGKGYVWSIKVPKYYSVQTIWADSSLHADHGKDLEHFFNLKKLTSRAIVENRGMAGYIMSQTLKVDKVNLLLILIDVVKLLAHKVRKRIIVGKNEDIQRIDNLGEIGNVIKVVEKNCF